MPGLDYSLVYQARKLAHGGNIHTIGTWIFCYEASRADSSQRVRFEKLLRDFVTTNKAVAIVRASAKEVRRRSRAVVAASDALNVVVDAYLGTVDRR